MKAVESQNHSSMETVSVELLSGRVVVLRMMKTSDLIFMEKQGTKSKTETERTMAMLERLSCEPKITVVELQELSLPDFRSLTELMGRAGGVDDDEESES